MATNLPFCFSIQFLEQLLKFLVNFTLLKYVKSQRSYGSLITKELIFGFQVLDLKDHFSASLSLVLIRRKESPQTLRLTLHANIFLNTHPVVVFSYLSLQPLFLCTKTQQCFTTATFRSFGHFEHLELPLSLYFDVHSLTANSKLVENFNQAASTRCSGDNKEKLSRNIRSEYASDFCHDRKSAFSKLPSDTFNTM